MKMLNAVTSMGHLPHTKLDNQQTHYDSVRSVLMEQGETAELSLKTSTIFWKISVKLIAILR